MVPLGASRTLRRLGALALASPFALALVEVVANPWAHAAWLPIWRTVLVAGPGLGLALGLAGVLVSAWRSPRRGVARVEGGDLVLDREGDLRRIPLAALRAGVVVPDAFGHAARVEIELASGDQVFAEVESVAAGEGLLAAAGIDAAQRRCSVPLRAPAGAALRRGGALVVTILGAFMALGFVVGPSNHAGPGLVPAWLFATGAAMLLAARVARPKSITIGADGIVIPELLRDRFVPFADVLGVHAAGPRLVLTLRGEAAPLLLDTAADAALTVSLRIREALTARSQAPAAQARLDRLARGDRTIGAWREAAAHLLGQAGDYRAAAFSEDDLAALLASPDASAEHRLGAALALASAGEAPRARVRVAADACASPRMRVALEKIAGGEVDDDAVAEALAAEAEAAEARA